MGGMVGVEWVEWERGPETEGIYGYRHVILQQRLTRLVFWERFSLSMSRNRRREARPWHTWSCSGVT